MDRLPRELLFIVFKHCRFSAIMELRQTSRLLRIAANAFLAKFPREIRIFEMIFAEYTADDELRIDLILRLINFELLHLICYRMVLCRHILYRSQLDSFGEIFIDELVPRKGKIVEYMFANDIGGDVRSRFCLDVLYNRDDYFRYFARYFAIAERTAVDIVFSMKFVYSTNYFKFAEIWQKVVDLLHLVRDVDYLNSILMGAWRNIVAISISARFEPQVRIGILFQYQIMFNKIFLCMMRLFPRRKWIWLDIFNDNLALNARLI